MIETIGAVIKAARTEALEETRVVFAAALGVTDQTIYYWEIGKRSPRADTFTRLLQHMPPHFAARLLSAAGMSNVEAWLMRMWDDIIGGGVANPREIFSE